MTKPHGIGVRSEEGHAAGTSGDSLRFSALVSQRVDKLSLIVEKLDMKRKGRRAFPEGRLKSGKGQLWDRNLQMKTVVGGECG